MSTSTIIVLLGMVAILVIGAVTVIAIQECSKVWQKIIEVERSYDDIVERSYDDIGADEWYAVSNTVLGTLRAMEGDDEQID